MAEKWSAAGTLEDIISCEKSITGQYLSGKKKVEVPAVRRKGNGKYIEIVGATENNLKNISVKIPLGTFTGVTGVSGSGKSSLINEILYKRLAGDLNGARIRPGKHKDILGIDQLDKVIEIDQSRLGEPRGPILPPIPVSLQIFEPFLQRQTKLRCADIPPAGFPLM